MIEEMWHQGRFVENVSDIQCGSFLIYHDQLDIQVSDRFTLFVITSLFEESTRPNRKDILCSIQRISTHPDWFDAFPEKFYLNCSNLCSNAFWKIYGM